MGYGSLLRSPSRVTLGHLGTIPSPRRLVPTPRRNSTTFAARPPGPWLPWRGTVGFFDTYVAWQISDGWRFVVVFWWLGKGGASFLKCLGKVIEIWGCFFLGEIFVWILILILSFFGCYVFDVWCPNEVFLSVFRLGQNQVYVYVQLGFLWFS